MQADLNMGGFRTKNLKSPNYRIINEDTKAAKDAVPASALYGRADQLENLAKQALSVARDAYDLFDEDRLKENEALTKAAFSTAHQAKELALPGVPDQSVQELYDLDRRCEIDVCLSCFHNNRIKQLYGLNGLASKYLPRRYRQNIVPRVCDRDKQVQIAGCNYSFLSVLELI